MFFPLPRYRANLDCPRAITIAMLCKAAGVQCKASGFWVDRLVDVVVSEAGVPPGIEAEPGSMGLVRITAPSGLTDVQAARYGLAAMAYSLFDLVARESIRGAAWNRPSMPKGRKPSGIAKSNAQRQREFQARKLLR